MSSFGSCWTCIFDRVIGCALHPGFVGATDSRRGPSLRLGVCACLLIGGDRLSFTHISGPNTDPSSGPGIASRLLGGVVKPINWTLFSSVGAPHSGGGVQNLDCRSAFWGDCWTSPPPLRTSTYCATTTLPPVAFAPSTVIR
jgi:hypothetical protein